LALMLKQTGVELQYGFHKPSLCDWMALLKY
jgi:hypothetical protein